MDLRYLGSARLHVGQELKEILSLGMERLGGSGKIASGFLLCLFVEEVVGE